MHLRMILMAALILPAACVKKSNPTPQLASPQAFVLPSDSMMEVFKSPPWAARNFGYKPSAERLWDLIHTRLDVQPDWEKQQLRGKATLKLEPYFYPQDTIVLDARGFEIHSVVLKIKGNSTKPAYTYNSSQIKIPTGLPLQKGQQAEVVIDYTARPNELPNGGSSAISDDRGLYFINADGKKPDMPKQIWTQGETRGARCWFPTIDEPNEKCTQEMRITVEDKYKTLSNGLLTSSVKSGNGLRTDVWEMKLPHAPYLFMMAVGDYAVVQDKWGKTPLQYWVEPKYKNQAKKIFGRTPGMIDYFSKLLDYPFPWPKYDQIVVRNFVSGAMENTSASVFNESLQSGEKELADHDWDGIIAHELFHQWFGDLVTLESWANLPLNESFANYSEYLWDEFRLGRDDADLNGMKEKYQYLYESASKREPLIRYLYNKPDDMFDSHSYAKGGRVLHLLRQELGDDAFFGGLRLYLKRHAFKTVEIHDLRLAMEEVCGRDLNWFFNQWFMKAGHPEIRTETLWQGNRLLLITHQEQDTTYAPLYRIDLPVEIKAEGKIRREIFKIRKVHDTSAVQITSKPELVLWDADASFLGRLEQDNNTHSPSAQYSHSGRGIHRLQALEEIRSGNLASEPEAAAAIKAALKDPFWACRETAVEIMGDMDSLRKQAFAGDILTLAQSDSKPQVRKAALKFLSGVPLTERKTVLEKALADSSLAVSTEALRQYLAQEYPDADEVRKRFEADADNNYRGVLASFYEAKEGQASFDWFTKSMEASGGPESYEIIRSFGQFLMKEGDKVRLEKGVEFLYKLGIEGSRPEQVIGVYQVLRKMVFVPDYREKLKAIREKHRNDDFYEILEYLD